VGRFLGRKRKSPRSIGEKVSYRYPEKLHYPENENCHYPTEEKQFTLREKKVIDFHTENPTQQPQSAWDLCAAH